MPLLVTETGDPRLGAIALWTIEGDSLLAAGSHLLSTTAQGHAPDRVSLMRLEPKRYQLDLEYSRIPCRQTMIYEAKDEGMRVDFRFWCDQETAFPDGIHLSAWARSGVARQRNHLGQWRSLDTMGAFPVAHLASEIELEMAGGWKLRVATPNPVHSFWKQAWDRREHRLEVLPAWPSQPEGGKAAGSVLGRGDTLRRTLLLVPERRATTLDPPALVGLSQHRDGASRSAMMYFDELPNRENWAPVSLKRGGTPHGQIASLLQAHPRARIGWVAMPDRASPRTPLILPGWSFVSPWILSDSLEPGEGKWSLNLFCPQGDSAFLSQDVHAGPSVRSGVLSLRARSISASPKPLKGFVFQDGRVLQRFEFPLDAHWRAFSTSVALAPGKTNRLTLYALGSDSMLFLDDVKLVGTGGRSMLANGGFEQGNHPYAPDSLRRSWSDFHGPEHLVKAPEAYRSWFRDLVQGRGPEGWESRAYVGCHGYHHDPRFQAPNPAHEFTVDSASTARLIARIVAETRQLGVYPRMLEFWRTPGFAYTSWLLEGALETGAKFLDVGLVSAGRGSGGVRYLQKPGKRMWGLPLNWWSDRVGDGFGFSVGSVGRVLEQGGVVQAGGHPEETFFEPTDRANLQSLLERMEASPGFEWTTPVDWARHADSLLGIEVLRTDAGEEMAEITLVGALPAGATVFWHPSRLGTDAARARLQDVLELEVRIVEGTVHAILPASPNGVHRIRFHRDRTVPRGPHSGSRSSVAREVGLTGSGTTASGLVFVQLADGTWRKKVRLAVAP